MLDADDPTSADQADQAAQAQASTPEPTAATDPAATDPEATASAEPASSAEKPPAKKSAAKKTTTKKAAAKKTATKKTSAEKSTASKSTAKKAATGTKSTAKRASKKSAPTAPAETVEEPVGESAEAEVAAAGTSTTPPAGADESVAAPTVVFQPPQPTKRSAAKKPVADRAAEPETDTSAAEGATASEVATGADRAGGPGEQGTDKGSDGADTEAESGNRRRRRRGGRRRRKPEDEETGGGGEAQAATEAAPEPKKASDPDGSTDSDSEAAGSRRRRRRRRSGDDSEAAEEPAKTSSRSRKSRSPEDEITGLTGSTRLEAKKQRRREGREAGRRRAPIVSEAEFLARREAVDRVMVIRQKDDLTQIAVLEDNVLVEHYVARESQTSLIGNVYLGRVQNVLPSMEAAFIDIGKGRNAVLYAGEVNWDALGAKNGQPRKIESVLKSGQSVLVQVTKDPVGHKGARLTSQISLPGRFLVYVPDGTTSGISRKLPDTERNRLKTLLKEIVPESAGVIVRTAAEGTSEEELTRDVERLTARWEDISGKTSSGKAPQLLYAEADLTLKVVRDLFTEDFAKLVVSGPDAWEIVEGYVRHVAPDLTDRLERYDGDSGTGGTDGGKDVFAAYRIDEQIAKGLDRKVWLPSGGSLVIDRTEAMTVVDVNTGKFTGSGGNLEETVTRNNLEAAEEMVRQLRLRDIGGIVVVDFIDMVLESNRDLVLRRLVECLGRDRTRHQVAEVTSLGLVQMTRKRIGTGLLEAFSETCEHCQGRGLLVHHEPVEPRKGDDDGGNRRGGRSRGRRSDSPSSRPTPMPPTPKDVAAIARPENADRPPVDETAASAVPAAQHEADQPELDQTDAVQPESPPTAESGPDLPEPGTATGLPQADPDEPDTVVAGTERPGRTQPGRPRKRSARRAQGPASTTGTELPSRLPVEAETVRNGNGDSPTPADGAAPVTAPSAASVPDVDPAPRVVTSVRRRGAASRPAGPPVGAGAQSATDQGGGPDGSSVSTSHVPVKRKGSRRR